MRAGCCPRCPAPEGTSNGHRPRSCSAQQPAWSTPWCTLNSGGSHRVKVQSISDETLLFGRSEMLRSREGAQEQHLSLGWDWHQGGTLPHSRPRALPHPLQAPGMRGQCWRYHCNACVTFLSLLKQEEENSPSSQRHQAAALQSRAINNSLVSIYSILLEKNSNSPCLLAIIRIYVDIRFYLKLQNFLRHKVG